MKVSELEKLASSNPEVRKALLVFTGALEKRAAQNATAFNEQVNPGGVGPADSATGDTQATGVGGKLSPDMLLGQRPQPQPTQQQYAMVPNEQQMVQQAPPSPAEEGAAAAQQFMAPFFDAALQGDVNAMNAISEAAGKIAYGTALASHEASMNQEMQMQDQMAQEAAMNPPPGSPEEQAMLEQQVAAGQPAPAQAAPAPGSPEEQAMIAQQQAAAAAGPMAAEQTANALVPEGAQAPAPAQEPAPGEGKPPKKGEEKKDKGKDKEKKEKGSEKKSSLRPDQLEALAVFEKK